MLCTINIQSACAMWEEPIKKACDDEQEKFKILPTYLS